MFHISVQVARSSLIGTTERQDILKIRRQNHLNLLDIHRRESGAMLITLPYTKQLFIHLAVGIWYVFLLNLIHV